MKKPIALLLLLCCAQTLISQVIYESFQSTRIGESRDLKILLPRGYNSEDKTEYPLVVVLDGDYLFEPVVGNLDYQAYWEDVPQCLVVGINQAETRQKDLSYSEDNYFPVQDSASFFEFIGFELIPYIESKYNVSDFRIIVGHDLSANFLNYYLFKEQPLFRAYISLSPDLAPQMDSRLQSKLVTLDSNVFYYMATSDSDIQRLRVKTVEADKQLNTIDNPNFHYRFDDFEDANHYSLVGLGIPKAINQIFTLYKPINRSEYTETVLTYEGGPYNYFVKKYEDIETFYGFKKKPIENDIRAIATASKKLNDMESLENISKVAKKEFPDSMISAYYMGMYFEEEGNIKKALQYYQSGLLLAPSEFIDKDMLLEKMYELKD
ncbi:alpha/beta hydrolase [Bizionia arctica]|uniref:Histidine kinase n=1 Tax=Bizionia arctica TaxID=1495645 RepID=A0A917LL47_9FLAO|nr:alpha/beta hydrolase-fold protein [Bizionia arctica]GGG38365.1 histidine kinase [Bizionia arctica]